MERKKHKHPIVQFLQFNIVGIINTGVDFVAFNVLTALFSVYYVPAKVISYTLGLCNSYILNSRWTFKGNNKRDKKQILLFVAVNIVSLCTSIAVMWICRELLNIASDFWCNVIATPASLTVNFFGNRNFVFKQRNAE